MQPTAVEPMRVPFDASDWKNGSLVEQFLSRLQACAWDLALGCENDEDRALWLELGNKLELFCEFERVKGLLHQTGSAEGIWELASRPAQLPAPLSIWAATAVGYYAAMEGGEAAGVERILAADGRPLAGHMLAPFHQGMGCAFAQRALDGLGSIAAPSVGTIDSALARFRRLTDDHADRDHVEVTLETFGFMAQQLLTAHVRIVAGQLEATCPELVTAFWHGVGRATYCGGVNLAPSRKAQRALFQSVLDVAREPDERTHAVAGFAWGATVANLREPLVVELLLDGLSADPAVVQAFLTGVSSALQSLRRWTTDDAVDLFVARVPARHAGNA